MPAFRDISGRRFGMLRVVRLAQRTPVLWECVCDCGGRSLVGVGPLHSGNTKSCGCRRREVLGESTTKHGLAGTRVHRIWKAMRTRCTNPNVPQYKDYGGRGITVCKHWDSFENFLADMGHPPDGHSIDRRDNNAGYSPENCYWATRLEQNRNARSCINLTVRGKTQCLAAWAKESGVSKEALKQRLVRGWDVETACTKPPRPMKPYRRSE
jgi:hypothetical protein